MASHVSPLRNRDSQLEELLNLESQLAGVAALLQRIEHDLRSILDAPQEIASEAE